MNERINEYKHYMFINDYSPKKIRLVRRIRGVKNSLLSMLFTLLGTIIIFLPFVIFYLINSKNVFYASIAALIVATFTLFILGGYGIDSIPDKIKSSINTALIGIAIAGLSSLIGFLLTTLV